MLVESSEIDHPFTSFIFSLASSILRAAPIPSQGTHFDSGLISDISILAAAVVKYLQALLVENPRRAKSPVRNATNDDMASTQDRFPPKAFQQNIIQAENPSYPLEIHATQKLEWYSLRQPP
mmetsp:Transcript_865/g.2168  ORF Transcript_865/g.2168 Transcript_865/m.2168 type:complete len:122 (+) Transcript_865:983-1348(+)